MAHSVSSRFTVRSYEVDSYAHLNNGAYVNWFEQGRLDWLLSLGFSYDGLAARQQWFVVGRTEVDFRRPLVTGEAVELTTELLALGRSSVRYRQVMRLLEADGSPGPLAAEALTVMVFSGEGGGSIPIPDDFRRASEAGRPVAG